MIKCLTTHLHSPQSSKPVKEKKPKDFYLVMQGEHVSMVLMSSFLKQHFPNRFLDLHSHNASIVKT